ncbi:hypothetical protein NL108_012613 [Boleophthalmus pectinirostris]|nr:hypothetical protein NL108_012613 [Boleophthalmus pectinirostris]
MEDTLQLGDSVASKNAPKSGRRARLGADQTSFEENRHGRKFSGSASGEGPPAKPTRRLGGWAEESSGSGSAKSSRRPAAEDMEDRRLRPQTPEGSDDEGDIPVIPDLDEVQEEDLTMQIAATKVVNPPPLLHEQSWCLCLGYLHLNAEDPEKCSGLLCDFDGCLSSTVPSQGLALWG